MRRIFFFFFFAANVAFSDMYYVKASVAVPYDKTTYLRFNVYRANGSLFKTSERTVYLGQGLFNGTIFQNSLIDDISTFYVDLIDVSVYPNINVARWYISDQTFYRDGNNWICYLIASIGDENIDPPDLDLPDPINPIPDPPDGGGITPIIPPGPPPGSEFPYNPPEYPDPPNYEPPVYPAPPVYDPPIYYPPEYPDPPQYPEFPGWPDPPEYPEYPDPPDYDDLTGQLGNLIGAINDMIANGGFNDGSQGDDGSGGTNNASGGNVFIKGMDQTVYGNLYAIEQSGTANALAERHLSAEEIALKIHDALMAAGLNAPELKVSVQESLTESGLSDYKIGLSVESAIGRSLLDFGAATDYGVAYAFNDALNMQCLDPISIAKEIGRVLESLGLEKDGIESAIDSVMRYWEPASGKFQIAFESALNNKGLSSENIGIVSETALANRNLSGAEIGLEVGNQMAGLGLSTKSSDSTNTSLIVAAIEGISVDNSDVVHAVGGLADSFTNYISGSLSSSGVSDVYTDSEDFDVYDTNTIPGEVGGFISSAEGKINIFREFVNDAFVFDAPAIDRAASATIDFSSFGSVGDFDLPVYNLDLSISPIVKFRTFELFCLYVFAFFSAVKIVHNAIAGC